jgi:2-polyprenyl-3-methyl-5-hydroxy-6-metoxy-1,4-benzoquinol methylase
MILPNLLSLPSTDAGNLIQLRDSMYAADLLITAVGHFDFFSWLSKNPAGLNGICSDLNTAQRPTDVMLTYFKALNLVTEENGIFKITKLSSEYLTIDSEWNLIPYFNTQIGRPIVGKMLQVLKTGMPASWAGEEKEKDWTKAMEREEFTDKFISGMDSRAVYFAPPLVNAFDFSKYNSILDVGGATGIYSTAVIAKYPHIKATVFEKPPADKIAQYAVAKRNLTGKIEVIKGNMFEDELPKGFDIHLYSHVLHDWNTVQNKYIIKNTFRNLTSGGIIMIHDAHLNREKNGPLSVAEYSILLMFASYGKCYALGEMEELLSDAGFTDILLLPTIGNRSIITGRKP